MPHLHIVLYYRSKTGKSYITVTNGYHKSVVSMITQVVGAYNVKEEPSDDPSVIQFSMKHKYFKYSLGSKNYLLMGKLVVKLSDMLESIGWTLRESKSVAMYIDFTYILPASQQQSGFTPTPTAVYTPQYNQPYMQQASSSYPTPSSTQKPLEYS